MNVSLRLKQLALGVLLTGTLGPAAAATFGGVEFPGGISSFADAVASYTPGTGGLTAANMEPGNALGAPDFVSGGACSGSPADCPFVSLGSGGTLVLRFTDNALTGSDSTAPDLWIFEVGPDVESTFVAVSTNGVNWFSVGHISGSTRSIDIDAFGFGTSSQFTWLRLIDDPDQGSTSGASVGADIDAVGAISTTPVPLPGSALLLGGALAAAGTLRRRVRSA